MSRREPPAYLDRLDSFLQPLRGTPYHAASWHGYVDTSRFDGYLAGIARHRSLAGASVLDLGTGTGGLLLACQRRGAGRLVGVEVDPVLHQLAQLRLADTGIESLLSDGQRVPLPSASFDVVVSVHVIEHARSPRQYLSEIARLVKPNGVVLVACPNRLWPVEPHGNIPFVTYLPIGLSRRLCLWRSRSTRVSPELRRQYHTATLLENYFTFLGIRKLCRANGLHEVEVNQPAAFDAPDRIDLAAWGRAHPHVERLLNAVSGRLVRDRLAPFVRAHPMSHLAHWLSIVLNWEIHVVLRKGAA